MRLDRAPEAGARGADIALSTPLRKKGFTIITRLGASSWSDAGAGNDGKTSKKVQRIEHEGIQFNL